MPDETEATLTPKGEQTRALILDTALALFQEYGYEQTTMRAIALSRSREAWRWGARTTTFAPRST
jgi:AcrR family transcriptional regulator